MDSASGIKELMMGFRLAAYFDLEDINDSDHFNGHTS